MGQVTFDDHQQAVLPMVLVEDTDGKPVIKGAMYSKVEDGLANGYLRTNTVDPMVGFRFQF